VRSVFGREDRVVGDLTESYLTNLVFLAFGAWGAWRGWRDLGHARASLGWPRVPGEVVASDVERGLDEESDETRRTVIIYRYDVEGTPHRGRRVFFGDDIALRFAGPGKSRLTAYPVGRAVQVAVDPTDRRRAVLEPGASMAAYVAWLVPIAVALLGVVGLAGG
jgi:hypothetical protein